uniref:Protein kinase domain-containing protein n=1 Tax=Alexandrium monilatum TaxID=311494 RepID=A0A7S4Q397_9DINO
MGACPTLESAGAVGIIAAGPGLEYCGLALVDKAGPSRPGAGVPPKAAPLFCGGLASPPEAALRLCGRHRRADAAAVRLRAELGSLCREALPGEPTRGPVLGGGTWSTVYAGEWRGRCVAVKAFQSAFGERPEETEQRWQLLLREACLLRDLRSPRVVQLLGACVGTDGGPCLLLELATGGTLRRLLHGSAVGGGSPRRKGLWEAPLRPAQRLLLASHVSEGVAYLHAQAPPIVHRDLKSQNVVVVRRATDGQLKGAKLIDFGLAEWAGRSDEAERKTEVRGSAGYMAPECLAEAPRGSSPSVGTPADVWALGCVLVETFGGAPPHTECEDAAQVAAKVLSRREPPDVPAHVDLAAGGDVRDDTVRRLLRRCFIFEAAGRPRADDLLAELRELATLRGLKLPS